MRTENFISPVDTCDLQLWKTECTFQLSTPCDSDVYNIYNTVMTEAHTELPKHSSQSIDICLHLKNEILILLYPVLMVQINRGGGGIFCLKDI